MSRKSRGFLTGLGIGAGVIGIAAGTAGALALAHKKAKEHNQTTMEYIKGKARKVLPKRKNVCDVCGCTCDECECFMDDDFDEISIDDVEDLNTPSLFDMDDEDVNNDITLLDRVTIERDGYKQERDEYKQKYEELLKALSVAKTTKSNDVNNDGEN